ncbi:dihydrolipoyl dehydrogenase family protein [Actinopolymorpha alba]|uniref:dihydrolipoyl dehydrogenase family protein n=1 Tax=Actinopolymorpha alba TaxID=533267 RepID=UPI00036E3BEF|nr:NAD(P)/FAD-dependent oxidoreductase [Actinopolymorpha alba]
MPATVATSDLDVDVVVIGAGPAGETAAGRCADAGLAVAIVERELVGGECSYWGCIPSKTLIRPGDIVAAARRAPGAAEAVTGNVDAAAAFAQRDYMTNNWNDAGQLGWLDDKGIVFVRGTARLAGERVVEVETAEGGKQRLTARRAVVLATGTTPLMPPIDGLADVRPWNNRTITAAKQVPRRLLVLGGGAVGTEMTQACRRLGSEEVTIVDGAPRLLSREEPFVGEEVRAAFEAEGIRVHTGVRANAVRREGDGPVVATLSDGRQLTADEILVAVGRRPATTRVGLETVGLTPGEHVQVDARMRATGVPGDWLYAIGDCNGRALLTHMGKYHGRVVGDVIAGRDVGAGATDVVPRVTFTDPQVCAVGMTEADAVAAGLQIRCVTYGTGNVAGAYVQGNGITGTSKLVVDTQRRVVIGATFTGPGIQELLHSATVAIVGRVDLADLWHAVPSFPTVSEVWLRLLEAYGL